MPACPQQHSQIWEQCADFNSERCGDPYQVERSEVPSPPFHPRVVASCEANLKRELLLRQAAALPQLAQSRPNQCELWVGFHARTLGMSYS